jgi:hypothetical protein
MGLLLALAVLLFLQFQLVYGAFNNTDCIAFAQNFTFGLAGTTDRYGNQLTSMSQTVEGLKYSACIQFCGHGSDLNDWSDFEQQLGLWLLPWLTLLAQLPYFTKNKIEDMIVGLLTIGSPTTAFYSVFITMSNRKWLRDKFNEIRIHLEPEEKERMRSIMDVLASLHQFPVGIENLGLLASTLSHKMPEENESWWEDMQEWFAARKRKMEASAWAQLALAVIVYGFGVAEAFLMLGGTLSSSFDTNR